MATGASRSAAWTIGCAGQSDPARESTHRQMPCSRRRSALRARYLRDRGYARGAASCPSRRCSCSPTPRKKTHGLGLFGSGISPSTSIPLPKHPPASGRHVDVDVACHAWNRRQAIEDSKMHVDGCLAVGIPGFGQPDAERQGRRRVEARDPRREASGSCAP